ncbi:ABC transporter substrate-binding protein, partial [Streptococcus pneumoniae]|nr:ABC transporter substrate-binding protein [Streptococcus pneumoniae]
LLGASVGAAQSASVRTVNVGLGYVPNVQFTPFYVADKLGYFKAEGLNVKFQHGYVNELMPLLLQGKLDFVVGDPEDAIFARTQGA